MKNKNIVYGLLALLGIYLVTKKKGSDDSTGGATSDVGNGSNDVDVMNPTPENRVPVKTPIVDVSSGGSDTPVVVRSDGRNSDTVNKLLNRTNTGVVPPSFLQF